MTTYVLACTLGLELRLTVKDRYTLYLEGTQQQEGQNFQQWQQSDVYQVNYGTFIAVRCEGFDSSPHGLLASIASSNQQALAYTDRNWKCTNQNFPNWFAREYDDRFWPNAIDLGENSQNNNLFRFFVSSISNRARYIWDGSNSNVVFCRFGEF